MEEHDVPAPLIRFLNGLLRAVQSKNVRCRSNLLSGMSCVHGKSLQRSSLLVAKSNGTLANLVPFSFYGPRKEEDEKRKKSNYVFEEDLFPLVSFISAFLIPGSAPFFLLLILPVSTVGRSAVETLQNRDADRRDVSGSRSE